MDAVVEILVPFGEVVRLEGAQVFEWRGIAIDEDDVNDMDVDIETGVMSVPEKPKGTYTDGTTYYDYKRKKWYTYH